MTDERRQRILAIAEELENQGLPATNSAVYARALGHRGHVVALMKERRAERAHAGGVAVVEEEDDEPEEAESTETPAATIQEDLSQLENAYESWHLALERLWQIELDGPLSEANFARKQWLEYQMVQNLKTQEQLRPALERAQVREAVYHARDQHDAGLEEAQTQAEAFLQAVANVKAAVEDLVDTFEAQVDPFFAPRDRRGHQAFDVRSGREEAAALLQAFFANDFRAADMFRLLMDTPLTIGMLRQALEACPRLKPFSETAITSYLSQHQPEGVSTNGQHR